jgi:hypothetical protein
LVHFLSCRILLKRFEINHLQFEKSLGHAGHCRAGPVPNLRATRLVAAGGTGSVHPLDHPADRLALFTLRSRQAVQTVSVLRKADALRRTLQGGPSENR